MSVQSEISRLATAKSSIATTLMRLGSTLPEGATLDTLATVIDTIQTCTTQKAVSVTLPVSGWSANAQTVSVSGVTADNLVIAAPAALSRTEASDGGVCLTGQGADTLTFSCDTVPTVALTYNVVVFNYGTDGTLVNEISDGSVTTAKIAENAVTLAKLASDVTAALGGVRVSATGTNGYWTYRKYSDGTFDAWATVSGTITNGYCSGSLPSFTVGVPQMFTSVNYGGNAMNVIVIAQAMSNGAYNLYFRNGDGGNITGGYSVNMQLHGNWQ